MGQGSDSCGGYEVDFDEFEEALERGLWPARDGDVKLSQMTVSHMRNAKRYCQNRAQSCNFSSDSDEWNDRADMFSDMIYSKERTTAVSAPLKVVTAPKAPPRGKMAAMICHCKQEYNAREADLKRGYGFSCSKSCAAIRRDFGRPKAKRKPL